LLLVESFRCLAQGRELTSVILEITHQKTRQLHEVVLDDTHDMEAVGHDAGIGKVTANQAAIGAGEIDADD
jgi:hypothetical protein